MHRRDAVTQTLAPWGSRAPQRDRMTRRTLCVLGALAAFPLRSQGRPVARIDVVHHDRRGDPVVESFFRRLAQLGWVEGRNLGVEYHHIGTGLRGLAPIVQAIVRLKCNLVVAYNTPAALAFKAEAPSMPMIFVIGGDPVALGLVESWARPGGNATGVTGLGHELSVKMLGLLKEVVPAARRVAVMLEAANPTMSHIFDATLAAARPRLEHPRLAAQLRLPAVYPSTHFVVNARGLMSYGIDWMVPSTRMADYVARMLNGEKPAAIPVDQPTRFELVVSMNVARHQGIHIPQSILLQATELIR